MQLHQLAKAQVGQGRLYTGLKRLGNVFDGQFHACLTPKEHCTSNTADWRTDQGFKNNCKNQA
jgi:hypothetical protein